ncbi:hypothetical protein B0H14DRAFT_2598350 [Mycena olivaceomarginata]|nr:hypothetical protein B0H14DRAFT_2598350 [Mycena olivaceomarginata]
MKLNFCHIVVLHSISGARGDGHEVWSGVPVKKQVSDDNGVQGLEAALKSPGPATRHELERLGSYINIPRKTRTEAAGDNVDGVVFLGARGSAESSTRMCQRRGLGKHQEQRIAPLIPAARSPYQEPQLFGLEAEIDTYSDAKITCSTLICQVLSKWYKYSWRQCSLPSPTKTNVNGPTFYENLVSAVGLVGLQATGTLV